MSFVKKFLVIITIFYSNFAVAACLDGDLKKGKEIIEKTDIASKRYQTQNLDIYMQIFDEDGAVRERYFSNSKKRYNAEKMTKNLIKFYKPANVKNTALLTHSFDNKDGVQWFYLPALRSINQLSTDDKNKSFMGSDYTNADIEGRNIEKDFHCLVAEDVKTYKILSTPKDSEDQYSSIEVVIDKTKMVPIKVSFFDKKNELLKVLNNKIIKKFDNLYLVIESEMSNVKRKSKTTISVQDVTLNNNISDLEFGVKNLQ